MAALAHLPANAVSGISVATDARTANQIKTVSEKLSTGAKAIEVQMTMLEPAESIPNQHLDEIRRLNERALSELSIREALVELRTALTDWIALSLRFGDGLPRLRDSKAALFAARHSSTLRG